MPGPAPRRPGQVDDGLFRLLVESVVDYAIFALDPRGNIRTWNEGAQRLKGYTREEIVGRNFSIFYPPEDVSSGKPDGELLLADSEGRWEDEGWRIRKDGTRFWANVVITALRDETGRLVGFGKVTRDLTERRAAEQERVRLISREQAAKAAAAAAQRAVKSREEFLSVAAHELKTPLTSLRAASQMLRRQAERSSEWKLPDRATAALRQVEDQGSKVGRLIEQLLDVSRLESGQLEIAREECDLALIVTGAVADARFRAPDRTVEVTAPPTLFLQVDPLRIEQVLVNLLDNALKYSEDGVVEVELTGSDRAGARVQVRDHGPGIPPERRGGLFEQYYRAHEDSHRSGLGLGLFVSQRIVEQHGGEINAEFPQDGGTTMVVTLPPAGEEPSRADRRRAGAA